MEGLFRILDLTFLMLPAIGSSLVYRRPISFDIHHFMTIPGIVVIDRGRLDITYHEHRRPPPERKRHVARNSEPAGPFRSCRSAAVAGVGFGADTTLLVSCVQPVLMNAENYQAGECSRTWPRASTRLRDSRTFPQMGQVSRSRWYR